MPQLNERHPSGRWKKERNIPSANEIRKILESITLLIRVPGKADTDLATLHAIKTDELDIYKTNLICRGDISWYPEEIKNLKVRFAYPAIIPMAGRWAGDLIVTVEDIFANISVEDLKPGTLVEECTRFVAGDFDEGYGRIWRPIFLVYDKE